MGLTSATKMGTKVLGLALYAGAVYLGSNAILAPMFNQKSQVETIWEKAKKEYDTYQEIKSEGIYAESYKEAKQKLDSIKTDRLYKKYGIEPPTENSSMADKFNKQIELQNKLYEQITEAIKSIDK